MSDALRMLVEGLGEKWRDKATLDDVCMQLELAGAGQPSMMRSVVLAKFGESIAEEYANASKASSWITQRDHKLGVWVACACACEALKHVTRGENRPRIAIETAKAWVRGEATHEQVREARDAASSAHYAAEATSAANAAYYTAYAASTSNTSNAADAAAYAAAYAAYASYAYVASDDAAYAYVSDAADAAAELRRLVSVIARSLQTFPVLLTAPS